MVKGRRFSSKKSKKSTHIDKIKCELTMVGNTAIRACILDGKVAEPLIDEWQHSWSPGTLTYRLNNYTNDWKTKHDQERAVTVAFRAWQLRIKDLKFKREYNINEHVNFDISFEDLEHFDNRKGVLAHAYFPGQGDVSGDICINDNWNWVPHSMWQNLASPPLVTVLMHEIGHALGLRHDNRSKDCIMYPSMNLGKSKNVLHEYDIERIQDRYGKRNLSQRILDYFIRRRIRGGDFDR